MLGEMNKKIEEVSRSLLAMHVREVLNKNKDGRKFRNLSDQEKENLRSLFYDLEARVNDFVQGSMGKTEDQTEEIPENTRTTVRDLVRRDKN
jgi:hypothetical protein